MFAGRFDGLTIGDQLRFDLSAVWRKTPIAIAGALNDPETAAKGAPSPIVLALNSPLAKLAFGGSLALGDQPSADGDLTASIPSIAALASFLDAQPPPVLAADDITITAKVKGAADSLTLRRRDADQRRADARRRDRDQRRRRTPGRLRHARRRHAGARTAARTAAALSSTRRAGGARSPSRSRLCGASTSTCVCPRPISTSTVSRSPTPPHPQSSTDGKLSATLMEAAAYGGRLQGEVGAAYVGRDLKMSARGELADADLGAAIADFAQPIVTGTGGAKFAARGLRRFARRRDREPDGNGLARGGGRLDPRRQPRGGAAPQPSPADRRRARHAPRRNGVRQGRGVAGARRRPRSGPTRRDDEPWRERPNSTDSSSSSTKVGLCRSMRSRRTRPARNPRTPPA